MSVSYLILEFSLKFQTGFIWQCQLNLQESLNFITMGLSYYIGYKAEIYGQVSMVISAYYHFTRAKLWKVEA